jgi:hypothetical protein
MAETREDTCVSKTPVFPHISSQFTKGIHSRLNASQSFQNCDITKDENVMPYNNALPDDRRCVDGCIGNANEKNVEIMHGE